VPTRFPAPAHHVVGESRERCADSFVKTNHHGSGKVVEYDTSFSVIARPANAFVAELIGAEDMMRLLRLVTVRNALQPLQPEVATCGRQPLGLDDSMRDVLARLLVADCDALPVADAEGNLVGQADLKTLPPLCCLLRCWRPGRADPQGDQPGLRRQDLCRGAGSGRDRDRRQEGLRALVAASRRYRQEQTV
jgi:hypothetical protein